MDSRLEESRNRLCAEFASITSSDCGVAQCYLSENDWDMERALNSFFEEDMKLVFEAAEESQCRTKQQDTENKSQEAAECIDLTEEEPAGSSDSTARKQQQEEEEEESKGKITLISWNVDGLDSMALQERARGLCSYLALYTPDIVFLQELVPSYAHYIRKRAVSYTLIEGGEDGYFTAIMLKKSRVKLLKSEVVDFPATQMLRNLLITQVQFLGWELCLMTSHLESCKEQSQERMNQLRIIFQRMKEVPDNVAVLFGGDTNLRDHEVVKVGGLPAGVCDVWEQLGKPEHCRYTWDTRTNSNKNAAYVSRCRFDRVFLRSAREGPHLTPDHMALVGLDKLDCGRYTSDHWGLYCSFSTGM